MLTSWSCTIPHNTKQVHKVLNLDNIFKCSELRLGWRNLKWSSQHFCTQHSVLIGLINRLRKRCLGTVKVFLNSTNEIVNCNLRPCYTGDNFLMKNVMVDIHFANILPHFAFSSWWVTILELRGVWEYPQVWNVIPWPPPPTSGTTLLSLMLSR